MYSPPAPGLSRDTAWLEMTSPRPFGDERLPGVPYGILLPSVRSASPEEAAGNLREVNPCVNHLILLKAFYKPYRELSTCLARLQKPSQDSLYEG